MASPAQESRRLRNAIHAAEAAGMTVRALRLHPDGTIDLLTGADVPALALNDDRADDWVALAGKTQIPRA